MRAGIICRGAVAQSTALIGWVHKFFEWSQIPWNFLVYTALFGNHLIHVDRPFWSFLVWCQCDGSCAAIILVTNNELEYVAVSLLVAVLLRAANNIRSYIYIHSRDRIGSNGRWVQSVTWMYQWMYKDIWRQNLYGVQGKTWPLYI